MKDQSSNIIIGQRIKHSRVRLNMTLEQVGELLGVHKSTVSRWEKGYTEKISLATISKLAQYFGVNEAWLSGKDVPMIVRRPSVDSVAGKILSILKYRNITLSELSNQIDIDYEYFYNYIYNTKDNDFSESDEILKKIAVTLGISVSEFFNYGYSNTDDSANYISSLLERESRGLPLTPNESNILKKYYNGKYDDNDIRKNIIPYPTISESTVSFPVIGELAAGYDHFMNEDYDTFDTVEIPISYLQGRPKSDFLVLKIHGSSMYPLYMNDDKVLIKKTPTLDRSGEIGVVQYEDYATLKKVEFVTGEDWLKLIPINPTYEPKTITGEELEQCHIIGIPVLLIREIEQ